jgi:hypothetical protein
MVADLISIEEAYGVDPATGEIDMDKFRRFAAQQEASLANMRANTQLSEPLQTLQANPELLNQATAYVASQGVAPGADFQAQVEDFAVQSPERQYLTVYPDVLAQATTDYQNRFGNSYTPTSEFEDNFARQHYYGTPFTPDFGIEDNRYGFGMELPNVDSGLMNIAKILMNVEDRNYEGQNADVSRPTYIFNDEIADPIALSNVYGDIGQNFKTNLLGSGAGGGMNEDMAGQDMSRFLRNVFAPSTNLGGPSMLEDLGGVGELARAYSILGVTGEGNSYADKQVRDIQELLSKSGSSLNMDGTGGADAMRADVGTADIGNFSVDNAFDAFSNMPPLSPLAAAYKASVVLDKMLHDDMSFTEALDDTMGFTDGNTYTPPVGFGDFGPDGSDAQ